METVTRRVIQHAQQLSGELDARAIVVYADALPQDGELHKLLEAVDTPAILVGRSRRESLAPELLDYTWVIVPDVPMTRAGQVRAALLVCLANGTLQQGDRVVCLTGMDSSGAIDTLQVLHLGSDPDLFSRLDPTTFRGDIAPEVFERALILATQLAVQGREGRPIGVLFVLGDSEKVLAQSRNLILNPFQGHPEAERNLLDPALEETIKEFASLDGGFVVRGDGVLLTAGSYLVPNAASAPLVGGLGTRHAAAAGITASTEAVVVCVSQSTGTVTVFKSGQIIAELPRPTGENRLYH